jgi:hypothetical protein
LLLCGRRLDEAGNGTAGPGDVVVAEHDTLWSS